MAARKDKKPSEQNAQTLTITNDAGKSEQRKLTEVKLSPDVLNALVAQAFTKPLLGELDFTEAVAVMREKLEKIIAGDLSELESTLTAQIVSLNVIFNALAKRSTNCEFLNQMEANMRPHGRNTGSNQANTRTRKTKNSANELLSEDNHAALDTRGTIETGRTHQEMATVETIDGR